MKTNKRHTVFMNCMNRDGFTGFIKHEQNSQTHYIFIYEKAPKG